MKDLRDLRAKVTVETDAVLDAVAFGTGKDRSQIAREVLHRWALETIDATIVLQRRMAVEGISGSRSGNPGMGAAR